MRGLEPRAQTPDLGKLLVCLALSRDGWPSLCYPYLKEMLTRNVRWVLQSKPALGVLSGAALGPHCCSAS